MYSSWPSGRECSTWCRWCCQKCQSKEGVRIPLRDQICIENVQPRIDSWTAFTKFNGLDNLAIQNLINTHTYKIYLKKIRSQEFMIRT